MANAPLMRRARGGMLHLRFDLRITSPLHLPAGQRHTGTLINRFFQKRHYTLVNQF
jgi:hypothetical protein